MTELLKKAFEAAARLPEKEQNAVAAMVLAELEADRQWDEVLIRGRGPLEALAQEALDDFHGGRTEPLDPESL
jgi:hypothetical protein